MKNRPYLICLAIVLSTASLLAQTISNDASAPRHYGTQNQFPIGEKDITAAEYCQYLSDTVSHESCWFYSHYYDSSFITTDQLLDWESSSKACIKRAGWSPNYTYTVVPGHENDIIDAVYAADIQCEFLDWRKNPTEQELCDYLNDKIAGRLDASYLAKASAFENRYPETSPILFQIVDQMVQEIYDGVDQKDSLPSVGKDGLPYYAIKHYSVSYLGASVWGLQFSDQNDVSLEFPVEMPVHAFVSETQDSECRKNWGTLSQIQGRVLTQESVKKEPMKAPKIPNKIDVPNKIGLPGGVKVGF